MCGRFSLHHPTPEVVTRFGAIGSLFDFPPRDNIAPTEPLTVVVEDAVPGGKRERWIEAMQWGLVPFWARDLTFPGKLLNASRDVLTHNRAYQAPLKRSRCIIPADGFYKWFAAIPGGPKQPLYIRRRDGGLFGFAGLWDEWIAPDGSPLRSCVIVTTRPNSLLETIDDNMPAILRPEDEAQWLDTRLDSGKALSVVKSCPSNWLEITPIAANRVV